MPPGRKKSPLPSQVTDIAPATPAPRLDRAAPQRPVQPMAPDVLADKATKLFSPNLFPTRRDRVPIHPLFAQRSSRLPPPAAEIDERPNRRSRRFKLFGQGVPELRICVLDPKRRWHLARWQPFVLPSHHGIAPPRRGDARRLFPRGRHIPREPWDFPPPGDLASQQQQQPPANHGSLQPAPIAGTLPFRRPPTRTVATLVEGDRAQRHVWRKRLKQHLWILDMEHERRFRSAMSTLMDSLAIWEAEHIRPQGQWPQFGPWIEGVNVKAVESWTVIFRTLRTDPDIAGQCLGIPRVPGHAEARQALEDEKHGRQARATKRKEKRERKRREKEEQERKQQQQEPPPPPSEQSAKALLSSADTDQPALGAQLQAYKAPAPVEDPTLIRSTGVHAASENAQGPLDRRSMIAGGLKGAKKARSSDSPVTTGPDLKPARMSSQGMTQARPPAQQVTSRVFPTATLQDTDALIDTILSIPMPSLPAQIGKHDLLGLLLKQLGDLQIENLALRELQTAVEGGRAAMVLPPARSGLQGVRRAEERPVVDLATLQAADAADPPSASAGKTERQRRADREHKKRQRQRRRDQADTQSRPLESLAPRVSASAEQTGGPSSPAPYKDDEVDAPSAQAGATQTTETSSFDADAFKARHSDLLKRLGVLDIRDRAGNGSHDYDSEGDNDQDDDQRMRAVSFATPHRSQSTSSLEAIVEEEESDDDMPGSSTAQSVKTFPSSASPGAHAQREQDSKHRQLISGAHLWRGDLYRDEDTRISTNSITALLG